MKFIDLDRQYQGAKVHIDEAIQRVLAHGRYVQGPEVEALESRLAEMAGVKHCVLVSSGTTALSMALMALDVGPGDEVITSPFSFFASAETILLLGAKAVFVDIDPKTYNLDPKLLEAAITPKTKAIMPVSLYGQCADFDLINAIADKHQVPVIEDAAQSLGATYKGRPSCGLTTLACTSFFPSKPLGCYGDGGACFTDRDDLAENLRLIRNHGEQTRYQHVRIGINGRCASMQAAILLAKLDHVWSGELEQRQQVARWYDESLPPEITTPYVEPHNVSTYAQYTVQVDDRDRVRELLQEAGIPTAVHYPKGIHEQPALLSLQPEKQHYPVTEALAQRVMSLPFHPYLTQSEVTRIANSLVDCVVPA